MLDLHDSKNALVLVPHEDDEINLMGGLLPLLVQKGIVVNVCFTTNGDYEVPGSVRIKEAINALKCLGIEKENIYFLGYPDGSQKIDHSLYKTEIPVVSKHGSFTYGSDLKDDYRMEKSGYHSEYVYKNFKEDLKDLIKDIFPDIVFCIDMDEHHDHKMTSLAFEECMEEILQESKNYTPAIYKGFAYAITYEGAKDFFKGLNLLPAFNNRKDNKLANPCFKWQDRVRFPIAEECAQRTFKNPLISAILQHKSQSFGKRIANVINSDVVFWELPVLKQQGKKGVPKLSIAKILLNDSFTYGDYYLSSEEVPCSIYGYGVSQNLYFKFTSDVVEIKNGILYIPASLKIFLLQLVDENGKLIDEVWIKRLNGISKLKHRIKLLAFRLRCYIKYKRQ